VPKTTRDRKNERWLLITVSTGDSSTLRVHAWRKLRSLGAVYLQQSVAILPERPATLRAARRLVDRIVHEGGQARSLGVAVLDSAQEGALIELFQTERADEFQEVCSRTPAFLEEIEAERRRGRTTYAEVEESEADLERMRTWLGRVRARDYFDAPGGPEAIAAVEECAEALAAFEAEALAAEVPQRAETPKRPRLRAVKEE
jgi:ChrB-like protein